MDWGEIHGNWLCCCAASCPPCAPSGGHRTVTDAATLGCVTPSLHLSLANQGSWQCWEASSLSRVRHLSRAVSCFSSFFFFTVLTLLNCWGIPYPLDYSPVRSAGHQQWFHVWSSPLSYLQGDYKHLIHFILPFLFFLLVLKLIYFAYISPLINSPLGSQWGIGKDFLFCHHCSYTLHSCVTANKGSTWFMSAFSNNRSWAQSRSFCFWGRTMTISALVKSQSSGLLRISIPTTVMTNKVAKNV